MKRFQGDFPNGGMVDDYDLEGPITFHSKYGHLMSGCFPEDCINDCSASGSVDDAVEYWVRKLHFNVPRDLAERYLQEFGAWDDLQTADDETLDRRILWTACCEIAEQGDWSGVCH